MSKHAIDDLNITGMTELATPASLIGELPATPLEDFIYQARKSCNEIIHAHDDRLIVVVGPCSIHDPAAALDYAAQLKEIARQHEQDLCVIMRVYFEKPRTTHGWKGLINDPDMDEGYQINKGLRLARKTLLDINALGVPCGVEYLDTISPQYLADLVTWGAIGARTTESQVHRELASGLSSAVGFKNATSGDVSVAVHAVLAAARPHTFLSVTKDGNTAIFSTRGNRHNHVILRGGSNGSNYDRASIDACAAKLAEYGLPARIMIDCSHANSNKDHKRQPVAAAAVAEQVGTGDLRVIGVMLESNIVEGKQEIGAKMTYGQSVTDACMSIEQTKPVLAELAEAVRNRRLRLVENN